jgi:hypothetical protein
MEFYNPCALICGPFFGSQRFEQHLLERFHSNSNNLVQSMLVAANAEKIIAVQIVRKFKKLAVLE